MKKVIFTIGLLVPSISFAAGNTIKSAAIKIATFLGKPVITLLFTTALAMFLWGIVDFIRNAENSEAREKGKQRMFWGLIALFVMVSFLGLTSVITGTLFVGGGSPVLPQFYQ